MSAIAAHLNIHWFCRHTWRRASYNTSGVCWAVLLVISAPLPFSVHPDPVSGSGHHDAGDLNGLLTSILLETVILARQMVLRLAFKTAIGMSLISMIAMEAAMNITDVVMTGGAVLTWWVIPFMLFAGFITPLPYNYWRLKALGKACH